MCGVLFSEPNALRSLQGCFVSVGTEQGMESAGKQLNGFLYEGRLAITHHFDDESVHRRFRFFSPGQMA